MLTVDKSRKNNQTNVNYKLTGGLYFFYKELNYNSILKNIKQTTEITNRNIRRFS